MIKLAELTLKSLCKLSAHIVSIWERVKPVVWLFILFILASGISAWIGNDWGRRIGKRKLTVFALRPKHTSSFLTILLSMCLSLGFLGTYLLIDRDAREALLQPEARQERESQATQLQMSQFSATLQQIHGRENSTEPLRLAAQSPEVKPSAGQKPAQNSESRANAPVQIQAPVQQANRPVRSNEPDDFLTESDALDDSVDQPIQTADNTSINPSRQQPVQPTTKVSKPEQGSVTSPVPFRTATQTRLAEPESSAGSLRPSSAPVQVAMLDAPVFELKVYGGRSPAESEQIVEGVLDMTRAYAEQLGLEPGTAPLLQVQQANLSQSQRALEQQLVYQLSVQIGKVSTANQSLPVKLVLSPTATSSENNFDPHQLLEDARLNPDTSSGSLQDDLQLAILNLAREARAELQLAPAQLDTGIQLATGELPFQVVRLRRSGTTLLGQIVMSADSANLTEN